MDSRKYVWYASYGSNLDRNRFMCYIKGGQPEGSAKANPGCRDNSDPLRDQTIIIPYPLYFAKQSASWGNKGVAFIGSNKDEQSRTLGRMYLITEEQFADVMSQENGNADISVDFDQARSQGSIVAWESWYGKMIYLGEEESYPVFTFTSCLDLTAETFVEPSPQYLKTIMNGLNQAFDLSEEQIADYLAGKAGIKDMYTKEQLTSLLQS